MTCFFDHLANLLFETKLNWDEWNRDRVTRGYEKLPRALRDYMRVGYFDHATYLMKQYERYKHYLRTQIEDVRRFMDALMYFKSGPEE